MDNKELKIVPPDGYSIDYENSTFECIKFKPIKKKKLTYDDIAKELFESKETFWMGHNDVSSTGGGAGFAYADVDNCTSEKQVEKLIAINKLMNVAKYLNGNWKPNFEENTPKYYIENNQHLKLIKIDYTCRNIYSIVYFKTEELAEQAIEILGEDTIRLALSTNW